MTRLHWKRIAGWTLFAAAFGYTEAMLVVYLRRLLGEAPGLDYRQVFAAKGLPFTSAQLSADMAGHGLLRLEQSREVATLLLLLGAAWAGGRTARERLANFLFTFAVWDLTYYVFLAAFLPFARRLTATDIYFLVPLAWYGPIWFPVLVIMPIFIFVALRLWRGSAKKAR